jgi:hypothetical protein
MKKAIFWSLAVLITCSAAIYQKMTGPTYPKRQKIALDGTVYNLKLVRSLSLDHKSEVRLKIDNPAINAKIYYKRYKTDEEYQSADFIYRADKRKVGLYAQIPPQPPAGKLQYYIEIVDSTGTLTYYKEEPIVIRFKGGVPAAVLIPHVLFMFIAMLFSTLAGLMAITKFPQYKIYAIWTLALFIAGGMILGPVVQNYAFGEFWTGIPFGWDLTDNKTLIALLFWILAVYMNRKEEKPLYVALAAFVLLLIYSIPHSMFGSELDYASGQVTQGMIINLF